MKRKLEQISNYLIAVFLCVWCESCGGWLGSCGLNDFLRLCVQLMSQILLHRMIAFLSLSLQKGCTLCSFQICSFGVESDSCVGWLCSSAANNSDSAPSDDCFSLSLQQDNTLQFCTFAVESSSSGGWLCSSAANESDILFQSRLAIKRLLLSLFLSSTGLHSPLFQFCNFAMCGLIVLIISSK